MKDKLVPMLVFLVVVGAFAVGLLYGKLTVYEKGGAGTMTAAQGVVGDDGSPPQQAPPEQVQLSDDQWEEMLEGAIAEKGDSDVKVTLVEFTDYQCPFCARYFNDTYSTILSDYVDSGKVRYILRDLPLSFHPNAKSAALAARCAGDQGKYFEMHDVLFENQESWSNGDPEELFATYAGEIGLDAGEYSSCYGGDKHGSEIDADLALATKVGATGTPTFFINGQKLVGAQPLAAFQAAIDGALEN